MIGRPYSILAPAQRSRTINWILLKGSTNVAIEFRWNDLKSRPAPMQNQERIAFANPLDDLGHLATQLLRIDGLNPSFHVQLKINFP